MYIFGDIVSSARNAHSLMMSKSDEDFYKVNFMMSEMVCANVWSEEGVVEQVKHFVNNDFAWHKLAQDGGVLNSLKKAAVLVPLFVKDGDIYVWLTLRSKKLRKDPGDVAFPGGKRDGNENEAETCLREAREEIGLLPNHVRLIDPVPPRISRHDILVTPVIGLVHPDFKPVINTDEVEVAFCLPLKRFLSKQGHHSQTFERHDRTFHLPFFKDDVDGSTITTWGLTAWICVDIAMGVFEQIPEYGLLIDTLYDEYKNDPKNPFLYQIKYLENYNSRLSSKL